MKTVFILLMLLVAFSSRAQNLNLRKAIQRSDLIIVSNDVEYKTINKNDFVSHSYVEINRIDTVLKKNIPVAFKKLTAKKYEDNEDYYSELVINGGNCAVRIKDPDNINADYNVFFLEKKGKEYHALLVLQGLEWGKYQKVVAQVRSMSTMRHLKVGKERFEETLDWFIANGLMPDADFINFYKGKGITTDSILYSDQQYAKAWEIFKGGEEDILPIVRSKFFDEVKDHYLQKMQEVIDKDKPEFSDYYDFDKAISRLTDNFNDGYDSGDYILNDALTSDKFSEYEKGNIMQHLLKTATDWQLKAPL